MYVRKLPESPGQLVEELRLIEAARLQSFRSHSSSCVDLTSERSLSSHATTLVDVF